MAARLAESGTIIDKTKEPKLLSHHLFKRFDQNLGLVVTTHTLGVKKLKYSELHPKRHLDISQEI
jgi:hypothetical protein